MLGDFKFKRGKGKKVFRSTRRLRRVGIHAFVGRAPQGTFQARACIVGLGRVKAGTRRQLKKMLDLSKRCSRDVTASTPRRAIAKALSSLGANMRK